jgi:hypothetical protein
MAPTAVFPVALPISPPTTAPAPAPAAAPFSFLLQPEQLRLPTTIRPIRATTMNFFIENLLVRVKTHL